MIVSPAKIRTQAQTNRTDDAPQASEQNGHCNDKFQPSRSGAYRLPALLPLGVALAFAKTAAAQVPQFIPTISGQIPLIYSPVPFPPSGTGGGITNNYPAPDINYTPPSDGLNTGATIGIAAGAVGGIVLAVTLGLCFLRRRAAAGARPDVELGQVPPRQ